MARATATAISTTTIIIIIVIVIIIIIIIIIIVVVITGVGGEVQGGVALAVGPERVGARLQQQLHALGLPRPRGLRPSHTGEKNRKRWLRFPYGSIQSIVAGSWHRHPNGARAVTRPAGSVRQAGRGGRVGGGSTTHQVQRRFAVLAPHAGRGARLEQLRHHPVRAARRRLVAEEAAHAGEHR
eukprot:COSAG01_NODE_3578_length_5914_cov_2.371625_7_plen_183_part_00